MYLAAKKLEESSSTMMIRIVFRCERSECLDDIIISGRSDCAVEGGCVGYSSLADCMHPPQRDKEKERSTMNSWPAVVDVGKGGSEVDITREGRRGRWFHRRTIIPKEGEGGGKHRTKNRNKSTSCLIAVSSVISKKSFARRLKRLTSQRKERGRGRTGYAPDVFEVTILGSRLFRSKGSLNLAKLCLFSIWVSTFESPFDQKIGIRLPAGATRALTTTNRRKTLSISVYLMGRGERAEPKNCRRVKMVSHGYSSSSGVDLERCRCRWVKKSVVYSIFSSIGQSRW